LHSVANKNRDVSVQKFSVKMFSAYTQDVNLKVV